MGDLFRITRILQLSEAAHWQSVIDRCRRGEAAVLKQDGATSVLLLPGIAAGNAQGPDLIIKRWGLKGAGAHFKSLLRASRAWRHWRGAERLTRAGVRTARCHAIIQTGGDDPAEWLIMERLPGKTLLRHMADRDLTPAQERALADALGAAMANLLNNGVWNRDGKPSNWIVTDPAAAQAAVIDCVAINRNRPGALFAQLPTLAIEAIGCGCLPRATLRLRAVKAFAAGLGPQFKLSKDTDRRATVRWLWREAARTIRNHGDPKPKVNPLSDATSGSSP